MVLSPDMFDHADQAEELLSRIDEFEKETGCKAVVVLRQIKSIGGICKIMTGEMAEKERARLGSCEWHVGYWRRDDIEELKKKLPYQKEVLLDCNPEHFESHEQVDRILDMIVAYEEKWSCKAGVFRWPRKFLPDVFAVESKEKAVNRMALPEVTDEDYVVNACGMAYWSRSYFESVKDDLLDDF